MYVWRLLLRNYNSAFTAATTIGKYIKNGSCLKITDIGGRLNKQVKKKKKIIIINCQI